MALSITVTLVLRPGFEEKKSTFSANNWVADLIAVMKGSLVRIAIYAITVLLKVTEHKGKSTLSRSSGCVQQAAPALPIPPKYHLATIFVFGLESSDAIMLSVTA